ncbi:alpha/beta hydrolase [Streptomyces sp. NPDC127084]|uniref:alpha/beta hydrolase n=1 Tax=Streptomyces sp. NPDC127084 TaxID=3347133 RepID=UPI00364C0A95
MANRPRRRRFSRTLLAALVMASVAVPLSGAARPSAVPAPVPPVLAPIRGAATPAGLAERYAANREGIRAAERTAAEHGDRRRATALRALAAPERQFLAFDGRDGGRTAEVFGDLASAERIAVLVPGSDTNLDTYQRFRAGAVSLHEELREELGERAAVVAWLGYRTPATVGPEVLTPGRAEDAAPRLASFLSGLETLRPKARVSLLCHSYGSVVCGVAASGTPAAAMADVSDIVLYGSPGAGVDGAASLRTKATVWAGRGSGDWIACVPNVSLRLPFADLGLGSNDPVSEEFGARVFAAGEAGHSDYLKPGSVALTNIARIVSGRAPSQTQSEAAEENSRA